MITIASSEADNTITNLSIEFDKDHEENEFPSAFHIELKALKNAPIEFIKIESDSSYPVESANIYTIDSMDTNKVVKMGQKSTNEVSLSFCYLL